MGIEQIKKIVELVAEGINVVFAVLNHEGIFKLFNLSDEVIALANLDKAAFLAELKDLSPEERKQVDELFKTKLVLSDKALEAKIEAGQLVVEDAVDVVLDAVEVVQKGKAAVEKFKELLA